MMYGYARVSREDQRLEVQIDALVAYGVLEKDIYSDKKTGRNTDREGLQTVLELLREGDEFVIYKIGRLSRDVLDFLNIWEDLKARKVKFTVTTLGFDLDSPMGKFFATFLALFAQFEADQISERTKASLKRKKEKEGIVPGRKKGDTFLTPKQVEAMLKEYSEKPDKPVKEIAEKYDVSYQTLNNLRKEAGLPGRNKGRKRH